MELYAERITFSKKPISIPSEYRPSYTIGIIVLILKICCQSYKSSLLKLHLINWALKSNENKDSLKNFVLSNYTESSKTWGIEPSLNRALNYSVHEGICSTIDGKYQLEEKGELFYQKILEDSEYLKEEIDFLNFLGKRKITDSRIDLIYKKWKNQNA
ncbi:hypothetical protein B0A58_11650 [Flavobacterium branchiophilum NBRC 15030 = ATCC 35035]|uniref:Uncharacterized protein n=1 Tax=Flavobacterium branchiophilum TaxID=55197 RepID=A0A543G5U3_9FLAO|nr:hypothetical protein [Flavobacterium branchiophilum]OXA73571.1 hypothetical protein B0A58_11650 [Flavobacterium branchiophilum NBRC 15030 = ATCC 35035]TQM41448.1 hypothetical protein BC670_2413 [Flavobacterium branchiophilum]GEM55336.1 hypothetical protein FB1_15570 [Flavobacterium branchiophilum NBRC 15030 = ATCC 35035]